MKAQAMRSRKDGRELDGRQKDARPDEKTETFESAPDVDEGDLDESDLEDIDDACWDVFVLDDDGEPPPEYGDFWFPD